MNNVPDRNDTPDHIVQTSIGEVSLTTNEFALLNKVLAGTATVDEGQALYGSVAGRIAAFPMEWEARVLRVTLGLHPDRADLVARLATVEEAISPSNGGSDLASRLAFEKAWVRLSTASLLDAQAESRKAEIRRRFVDDACSLLSSSVFNRQPLERRVETLVALHFTLLSAPAPDLLLVADLGLRRFGEMLQEPALTEPQACAVYDALHSLYFAGASDVRDLRRFDTMSPVFEALLETRHGRHARPPAPAGKKPLTLAYLLHTAHFNRGNAVSPLIASLAEMHATRPDRRILLYAVQHVGDRFVEQMAERGVEVRAFDQGYRYDRIDEVADDLKAQGVDVVLTDQNRAIAASLFVRRVAPRQIWIDTGFPFWRLSALDWTLSPAYLPGRIENERTSGIVWRQKAETLRADPDPEAVARLRDAFPPDAFVLGVFVRLAKLDHHYLDFLRRLLAAEPRFHLVVAGPGDSSMVEAFVSDPDVAARTKFVAGNVDLDLYGPAIDLMCDTFPFVGGLACRQVAAHGTPTLSKLSTPWDGLLMADRNPDLLAKSEDEYIALAKRLADDPQFRSTQRRVALEKAAEYSDAERMLNDVEAAIAAASA